MITLVLAFHNHQPVGNFGWVIEEAYQQAYRPLLGMLHEYPDIRFAQHYTGILLDWFEENHPEFVASVEQGVASGQVELLSGGYYEPIMAMLPERDRIAQITKLNRRLAGRFAVHPTGMWLAERVWEPSLPATLNAAGIAYTILDDTHFKAAGLEENDLTGYFLTEDQGRPLAVLPIDKRLRYTMPFEAPEATLAYLKSLDRDGADRVVVFADDGEKFGVWPDTYRTVYEHGWLRRFCDLLIENRSWLRTMPPGEVVATMKPAGRIYLPTASYAEMLHWALPTAQAFTAYDTFEHILKDEKLLDVYERFVRGGFWRNFLVKYPEASGMHKKMLRVSARVARLSADLRLTIDDLRLKKDEDPDSSLPNRRSSIVDRQSSSPNRQSSIVDPRPPIVNRQSSIVNPRSPIVDRQSPREDALAHAYDHLMAAQCNCPYWHGVFGGLYLANIRSAMYREMITAERELDAIEGCTEGRVSDVDYDLDGVKELLYESPAIDLYISPAVGGAIFEFDHKPSSHNFTDLLQRRREGYHARLAALGAPAADAAATSGAATDTAAEPAPAGAATPGKETPAAEGTVATEETPAAEEARSIHDIVRVKEAGLEKALVYDSYRHGLLVDHFFGNDISAEKLRLASLEELGDFVAAPYESSWSRAGGITTILLARNGTVAGSRPVRVEKAVSIADGSADIRVDYTVRALDGKPIRERFGIELAYMMSAGTEPDRYYEIDGAKPPENGGQLNGTGQGVGQKITLVDEWMGVTIAVDLERPAMILRAPIETVSLSEEGFERNYQGSVVVAVWDLEGATEWRITVRQGIRGREEV